MRPVIRALVLCLGVLFGIDGHAEPADHQVDPARDMVMGGDAPNELVVYLSPGCPACLNVYRETFAKILEDYVVPGHLRVVLRQIPQVYHLPEDSEKKEIAARNTAYFAILLECVHEVHGASGAEGAVVAFYKLAQVRRDLLYSPGNPAADWPYIAEDDAALLSERIRERGVADLSETAYCFAPGLRPEFYADFDRNAQILQSVRESGQLSVPAYFLNGVEIPFSRSYGTQVLETLAERIR